VGGDCTLTIGAVLSLRRLGHPADGIAVLYLDGDADLDAPAEGWGVLDSCGVAHLLGDEAADPQVAAPDGYRAAHRPRRPGPARLPPGTAQPRTMAQIRNPPPDRLPSDQHPHRHRGQDRQPRAAQVAAPHSARGDAAAAVHGCRTSCHPVRPARSTWSRST
jgi:hypothetical protein